MELAGDHPCPGRDIEDELTGFRPDRRDERVPPPWILSE
jgi:hypothetical protein